MKLTCDIDDEVVVNELSRNVAEEVLDRLSEDWMIDVLAPSLKPLITQQLVEETLRTAIDEVINQEWDRVVRCIDKSVDEAVLRKLGDNLKISLEN